MRLPMLAAALLLSAAQAHAADPPDHLGTFAGANYTKLCNAEPGSVQYAACLSYTAGAYDAYLHVDAAYILTGHPLYCPPKGGVPTTVMAQLVKDEIALDGEEGQSNDASDMMLTVLMGRFPCPKQPTQ